MRTSSLARSFERLRGDLVFEASLFCLPFENFFFAPSRGWAAIAPIGFFLYCLLNLDRLAESLWNLRFVLLFLGGVVVVTAANYLLFPPDADILIDVYRALLLGVAFLVALDIYFHVRRRDPGRAILVIAAAYGVSLLFGVLQLVALRFDIDLLIEGLHAIGKRSVLLGQRRVQFTFTEPAYLGMHLYGVLFPLAIFFAGRREAVWLWRVLGSFVLAGLLFGSSLKFRLDTVVVVLLWAGLMAPWRRPETRRLAAGLGVLLLLLGTWLVTSNPRLQGLLRRGLYGDASVAARYFRIHASLIGYSQDPLATLTGHGISNLWVPFEDGYDEARLAYANPYTAEVDRLRFHRSSSLLSMPIRVISEMGLIGLAAILFALYDRRFAFLYAVMLYLYLGFDSYAFYTVWLYVFFVQVLRVEPGGNRSLAGHERRPSAERLLQPK